MKRSDIPSLFWIFLRNLFGRYLLALLLRLGFILQWTSMISGSETLTTSVKFGLISSKIIFIVVIIAPTRIICIYINNFFLRHWHFILNINVIYKYYKIIIILINFKRCVITCFFFARIWKLTNLDWNILHNNNNITHFSQAVKPKPSQYSFYKLIILSFYGCKQPLQSTCESKIYLIRVANTLQERRYK